MTELGHDPARTDIGFANAIGSVLSDLVVHAIYNYASDAGRDPQRSLNWIYDELQRALAESTIEQTSYVSIVGSGQACVKSAVADVLKDSVRQAACLLEVPAPDEARCQ